jgi:asparagine synthase (glutamine-hydrolysing)
MSDLLGSITHNGESTIATRVTKALGTNIHSIKKPQGIFLSNKEIIEKQGYCITGILNWFSINSEQYKTDQSNNSAHLLKLFLDKWIEQKRQLLNSIDGEFAIVIWAFDSQESWVIRDIFGAEPLHYFEHLNNFVFASNAKSLWTIPPTPPKINEDRILDFIVDDLEHVDQESTFKKGIYKTPMGSIINWGKGRHKSEQYWNPNISEDTSKASGDQILEQFQEYLENAISKRLDSNAPSGLTLSGGLDSNTILSCWNPKGSLSNFSEKHLFSLIPEKGHRSDPESEMLLSQQGNHGGLPHHWITPSAALELIGPAEKFIRSLEDPFAIHSLSGTAPCFKLASKLGIKQVIDGIDGDMMGGIPSKYWYFLWRKKYYVSSLKECFTNHKHEDIPISLAFIDIFKLILGSLFPPLRAWKQMGQSPDQPITNEARNLITDLSIQTKTFNQSSVEMRLRLLKSNHHPTTPTTIEQSILNGLKSPMLGVAIDRYRLAADAFNIQTIHPLIDRTLAEFLLSLHWKYRVQNGTPKYLFRLALKKNGEDKLANQKELGHVGPWFTQRFSQDYLTRHVKPKPESLDALAKYVNIDFFQESWLASKQKTSINDQDEYIWRLNMLSEWLVENQ